MYGMSRDDLAVGTVLESNNYGTYVITSVNGSDFGVKFNGTGYETTTSYRRIKDGFIKDRLYPSVLGVGCIGDASKKDNLKEYRIWHRMLSKCYSPQDNSYEYYGAKGVTVSERWLNFTNFLKDYKKLREMSGYSLDVYLELDKDSKQFDIPLNERVYSFETCALVPKGVNQKHRSSSVYFDAVSPEGAVHCNYNIVDWLELFPDHSSRCIYHCIEGKQKTHKGWKFTKTGKGTVI